MNPATCKKYAIARSHLAVLLVLTSVVGCTRSGAKPDASTEPDAGAVAITEPDAGAVVHSMTPSGTNVTVSPSTVQSVNNGATQTFTVTAVPGHKLDEAVGGTCPAGAWNGTTYTTGAISADCTVVFSGSPLPPGIPASFFGTHWNWPGGEQAPPWPLSYVRTLSEFGRIQAAPGYRYAFAWETVEPSNDSYDWEAFDSAATALKGRGATGLLFSFDRTPYWAVKGNNKDKPVTSIALGSPPTVTTSGDHGFPGGGRAAIRFYGGSLPSPLVADKTYCIVGGKSYAPLTGNTFQIQNCDGSQITTTGGTVSAGTRVVLLNSLPANPSDLKDLVNHIVDRADMLGLPIVMVEGPNEWSNTNSYFWQALGPDLTTFQNLMFTFVKAKRSSIKVLMAPLNSMRTPPQGAWPPSAAAEPSFDVYAVHYYIFSETFNTNTDILASLDGVRAFLDSKGRATTNIILTEGGIDASTTAGHVISDYQPQRARHLAQVALIAASRGLVGMYPYIWGSNLDTTRMCATANYPANTNRNCPVGSLPTQTGVAYQQVRTWLLGASGLSAVPSAGNIKTIDMTLATGRPARAIWTADNSSQSVQLPAYATTCRRLDGTTTACSGSITVTGMPILVVE